VGIKVGELVGLEELETLEDAFGITRPPQSFQYFEAKKASSRLQLALG